MTALMSRILDIVNSGHEAGWHIGRLYHESSPEMI